MSSEKKKFVSIRNISRRIGERGRRGERKKRREEREGEKRRE